MTPESRTSRSPLRTRRCTAFATPSRARSSTTRPARRATSRRAAARTPLQQGREGRGRPRPFSWSRRDVTVKTPLRAADRENVSQRMRIVAAAGLVAVLALGGGFLLLGRGPSVPSAAPVIKPLHPVKKHPAAVAAKKAPLAVKKAKTKTKVL